MSKVNISVRARPPLQNIPLRTDLGTKLRKVLREQQPTPRALIAADVSEPKTQGCSRHEQPPEAVNG